MTKLKNLANKIFISLLIIVSFCFAQTSVLFSNYSYESNEFKVSAVSSSTNSDSEDKTSDVSNNNFKNTGSGSVDVSSSNYTGNSSYILMPSNWTRDGTPNKEIYSGVINIEENNFQTNYENFGLTFNQSPRLSTMQTESSNAVNVLMINSKTATTYGFTSSSISLDENSFYSVSVTYYTGNELNTASTNEYDNPRVSFYLIGDDFKAIAGSSIVGVQSNKNWRTATFWISTNQTAKTSFKLGVYLGTPAENTIQTESKSAGYAFFDSVKLFKHSKNFFDAQNKTETISGNQNSLVDLSYANIASDAGFVEDGDFNNTGSKWTVETSGASTARIINSNEKIENSDVPYTNARDENNYVATIYNRQNINGTSFGAFKSSDILIKQHTTYRISFWTKTSNDTIYASVKPTAKINGNEYSPAEITSVSTTQNKTTNNWTECVFFVTGNSLQDAYITLTLGLKSSNNSEDEYAFFDNVTTQIVSTKDRDNASNTSATYTSLSLNPSDSATIKNGSFNIAESVDKDVTYPLAVSGWTYDGTTNSNNKHGIVNIDAEIFNATRVNFGSPSNRPPEKNTTSNVLMFWNNSQSSQTYTTTSTFTASSNTAYVFSVAVCTMNIGLTGGANIYIKNSSDIVIAQILDINTNGQWKTFEIYLNNYSTSQTLKASLSLGRSEKQTTGYAYFDDCSFETTTKTISDIQQTNYVKVANLAKSLGEGKTTFYSDSFEGYGTDQTQNLYTPLYWKGEGKAETTNEDEGTTSILPVDDVKMGVINNSNMERVLQGSIYKDSTNSDALMIHSETPNYYAVSNQLTLSMSSSSYYKLVIKVKTVGINTGSEDDETPYGASIILDTIEQSFVGINTNGNFKETDDGWEDYTFYINTTDAIDLKIWLGLGSKDALTSGYAFFDDITIEKMEQEDYEADLNVALEDETKSERVISIANTTKSEDPTDDPSSRTFSESLTWLSIPTLIIGLGIIIAVAGYCINKFRKNRPVKVKVTNNYDRSNTLLKELDHRNYKSSVNHRLKLLYEELEQTKHYLEEEKAEHEKQVEAYETAKEIAENDKSIQLETPDKKYVEYEKNVKQLEENIASIKADIQILEEEQKQLEQESKNMRKDDLKGNKIVRRK